jgi:RHS repeat-associated protein
MDGDVITFAWDWASGVPEMLSDGQAMGSSITLYLVGHETLGRWDGADWTYYLPDALGSIRQETDGTGAVTDSREWTPFGVEVGTAQEGLGYTGEWYGGSVELLYLRARWYAVEVGRFTSPDPVIADFHDPRSINRYVYVLGNPVNAVDPSGLYHSDVHYGKTIWWAYAIAHHYGLPRDLLLAKRIADGDEHVDDWRTILDSLDCLVCHFCPSGPTYRHVQEAIGSGNPYLFGATLHQLQDLFAHWNEGYDDGSRLGHGPHSGEAGASPLNPVRSPGGKSQRNDWKINAFFSGGSTSVEPSTGIPGEIWPPHPREDVIAQIRARNPGIDLNGLNNDDLIDLYLRLDHENRYWAWDPLAKKPRFQVRNTFGIDPDAYVESSGRDLLMRNASIKAISEFMGHIATNPCAVDWTIPEDSEIRVLLESTW